jgi:SH3 domain-containing YSC84-like protein 1
MSVFDKFKQGAFKAGAQASTLLREGSSRVQSSSQSFAQGFSLPGEAEKAAKILATFLGLFATT